MNGWGMDEKPFLPLNSSCDVLFLSDYNSLDFSFDFSKYEKNILIAYSAGVFMSAFLSTKLPEFDLKIAVNGVLPLFDLALGLPEKSVDLMKNVSLQNYMELRKTLITDVNHLEKFNNNQPFRDIESSLNELSALCSYYSQEISPIDFDKIIIAEDDELLPLKHQLSAWSKPKNIKTIIGGHFPFYNFSSFDEIINL